MNNNNNNDDNLLFLLPADITIDILSRLPVESVLQCKRVCKSLKILINNPLFGHTHTERLLYNQQQQQQQHSRSAEDDNNKISFGFILRTSQKGLVEYLYGEYNIHLGAEKSSSSTTFRVEKPGLFPLEEYSHEYQGHHMNPVDSCNGFICLVSTFRDNYNMCVYNPLTTECVNLLPTFMVQNGGEAPSSYSQVATGFAYHPAGANKEYKIVRIYYEDFRFYSPGQLSVYTLGSGGDGGGWRSKGETLHQMYGPGVFLNGALHWLTANGSWMSAEEKKKKDEYIVSFDMVDEEFRIIPLPPPNVDRIQLGVLEGCLSVTGVNIDHRPLNSSEVWVMSKDYKWSKKYNIPWTKPNFAYRYSPPLGLAPPPPPPPPPLLKKTEAEAAAAAAPAPAGDGNINNKILLHYRWMGMVSYDTKTGCLDHGNIQKLKLVNWYDLIPYTKTFATLKALGEDGERTATSATSTTTQSRKRKRT